VLPTVQDVARVLQGHVREDMPGFPEAPGTHPTGVLLPILWDPEPVCVATVRAAHIRHGGEVCFPGGRPSPGDDGLFGTAEREAREELDMRVLRPLGALSSIPVYGSPYRIHPFAAQVEDSALIPDPSEVAGVLRLPLRAWLSRDIIDGIAWRSRDGEVVYSPIFEVDGYVMFGATAHCLLELMTALAPLFGLQVPPLGPGRFVWEDMPAAVANNTRLASRK